ncbi:MAG: nucleotidyl transferase AbiEii/AbiGii toxin family protein [Tepidisphaerales bacterium]
MLEKVIHLLDLLSAFQSHPFLRGRLALKGGSALNLFHFDVPRLSVDIDLNYVGAADREIMLQERPKVEQAIAAVCGREGMTVIRVPTDHAGGKWHLRYASAVNETAVLAVDLNYMFRVPLWPLVLRHSRRVGSYHAKGIPVLDLHELAAGKLAALFARHASRDLFDAHGLLRDGELDRARLRLGFVVYGALNRKDWRTVRIDDVDFDSAELLNELLPVLRAVDAERMSAPASWAGNLVIECREALSAVLPFTYAEREFLDRILDHGEIVPTLLTSDPGMVQRIASHPMLQWKAQNVRQHKGG